MNISMSATIPQVKARVKTVTRRLGWDRVKVGDRLTACEKCQGLKKGEKVVPLADIIVVSVRREPLNRIDAADCIAEGFGHLTPAEFVKMFCRLNGCEPQTIVARIEFKYATTMFDAPAPPLISMPYLGATFITVDPADAAEWVKQAIIKNTPEPGNAYAILVTVEKGIL